MAENKIVKFCAQVGLTSISLVMTNCPHIGVGKVTRRLHFLANRPLSVNISKTVQERDNTYNGRLIGNRIWPIKWQQRQ